MAVIVSNGSGPTQPVLEGGVGGAGQPVQVFLLSPAHCGGKRAQLLLRAKASFDLATRLQQDSAPIGEVFTFLSGLYFRGKLAYSERYGRSLVGSSTLIITPTRGLQWPSALITLDVIREFATVDVHADNHTYRAPLERDLSALNAALPLDARVILLGSIATSKYVDPLVSTIGSRLHYPDSFVGRGDMSRGGLLLRAARSGVELPYRPLDPQEQRRGPRPPRLGPE